MTTDKLDSLLDAVFAVRIWAVTWLSADTALDELAELIIRIISLVRFQCTLYRDRKRVGSDGGNQDVGK